MNTSGAGLSAAQRQRALGAVIAAAAGDALGAPYEFQPPVLDSEEIDMIGGGVLDWQPGEWTDETAMAIVVLEASLASAGDHDLRIETAQDHIAREWYSWSLGTPDIGTLTSQVVRTAAALAREDGHYAPRAKDFRAAAASAHEELPASAGNGSLMRVHASVLPYLLSPEEHAVEAIEAVCRLTHVHPDIHADVRPLQRGQVGTRRIQRGPVLRGRAVRNSRNHRAARRIRDRLGRVEYAVRDSETGVRRSSERRIRYFGDSLACSRSQGAADRRRSPCGG